METLLSDYWAIVSYLAEVGRTEISNKRSCLHLINEMVAVFGFCCLPTTGFCVDAGINIDVVQDMLMYFCSIKYYVDHTISKIDAGVIDPVDMADFKLQKLGSLLET